MGLDTECDLAIEARRGASGSGPSSPRPSSASATGCSPSTSAARRTEVAAAVADAGSLVRGIERLRRPTGRSLVPFEPPELGPADRALAESEVLDPEKTPNRWRRVERFFARRRRPRTRVRS